MPYTRNYPWQVLTRLADLTLAFKLPFSYDPHRLQQDTSRILADFDTTPHYRWDHHDGGWEAISLIGAAGSASNLRTGGSYLKTPAMERAPYIEEVLDDLPCQKYRVRLMRLAAGKNIFWHIDEGENMDAGHTRLHIPIATNPCVEFQISHENMRWRPGELWYGDFSFPHRLHNGGGEDRIHLVIDLRVNEFLRGTIPRRMTDETRKRERVRPWAQQLCTRYSRYVSRRAPEPSRPGPSQPAARA
jgi:hypothetical protein